MALSDVAADTGKWIRFQCWRIRSEEVYASRLHRLAELATSQEGTYQRRFEEAMSQVDDWEWEDTNIELFSINNKSDSAHSQSSGQLVPQTPHSKSPPPFEDVALANETAPCTTSCSTSSPMTPPKICCSKQSVLSEAQIALIAKNKKLALERRMQNSDVKRRREDEEIFQSMQWLP